MTGKKIGQKLTSASPVAITETSCFVPVPSSFIFLVSRVSNNDSKLQNVAVGRNNSAAVLMTFKINCVAGRFVWAKERGRTGCLLLLCQYITVFQVFIPMFTVASI